MRGLAVGDFLLLVELGEGQAQGEGEQRRGDGHVGENFSVRLLPAVHQQIDAGEHGNQDHVGAEKAEEIRGFWSGFGLGGRNPSEGDEASGNLRNGPAQVKPRADGRGVVEVDPVADEGCDRADDEE